MPREAELWAEVWRLPQAVMWEANHSVHEVALYVRALAIAEGPKASAADRTLVRQLQESLGVSMSGMLRFFWRIEGVPEAKPVEPEGQRRVGARDRLRAV